MVYQHIKNSDSSLFRLLKPGSVSNTPSTPIIMTKQPQNNFLARTMNAHHRRALSVRSKNSIDQGAKRRFIKNNIFMKLIYLPNSDVVIYYRRNNRAKSVELEPDAIIADLSTIFVSPAISSNIAVQSARKYITPQ